MRALIIFLNSLTEGTTTILHPSRVSLNTGDYCSSPFEGSWLGKEIEIRDNGENVFINHADEPTYIDPSLSDCWMRTAAMFINRKFYREPSTINVAHLVPGIYFCIVDGKQGVIRSHKLLVR